MTRKRVETRAEGRAELQRVARVLFDEMGYERVKIGDIVRAIGSSHGWVYTQFLGKDDLLVSLLAEDFRNCAGPADLFADAAERIHRLVARRRGAVSPETLSEVARAFDRFVRNVGMFEWERWAGWDLSARVRSVLTPYIEANLEISRAA